MIPHNLASEQLRKYLCQVKADFLIAEAGAVDLVIITVDNKQLKNIVWVAKEGSKHMDWDDVPKKLVGSVNVAVWHELVEANKSLQDTEVPAYNPKSPVPSISAFWPNTEEFVEYENQVQLFILFWCHLAPLTKMSRTLSPGLEHFSAHCLEAND